MLKCPSPAWSCRTANQMHQTEEQRLQGSRESLSISDVVGMGCFCLESLTILCWNSSCLVRRRCIGCAILRIRSQKAE